LTWFEYRPHGWQVAPRDPKSDTEELRTILEGQRAKADLLKKDGIITPRVFFREGKKRRGRPIGDFKRNWATACEKAALPGLLARTRKRTFLITRRWWILCEKSEAT
jgi:hypothetical protein